MIWKLLKRNISKAQMVGYGVSSVVGLVIVTVAVQMYSDLRGAFGKGEEGLMGTRDIVISKQVGMLSTLTGKAPEFSEEEIEAIEGQEWCSGAAPFQAADFSVYGYVEMAGRRLSTSMFLESVPDEFVDLPLEDWQYQEGGIVPLTISKDYLALYNFGYATTGRMPVLSESVCRSIEFTIILSGNGHRDAYRARIAGFSSRLNTIAVPQTFMEMAHRRYGTGERSKPSRLIVRVSDAANPQVTDYMRAEGYEIAGPPDDMERAKRIITLIIAGVIGVGFVITLLSVFIMVLSVYLMIEKSRKTIGLLLALGYTPRQIRGEYLRLIGSINGAVVVIAIVASLCLQRLWQPLLSASGLSEGSPTLAMITALLLPTIITLINALILHRRIN